MKLERGDEDGESGGGHNIYILVKQITLAIIYPSLTHYLKYTVALFSSNHGNIYSKWYALMVWR